MTNEMELIAMGVIPTCSQSFPAPAAWQVENRVSLKKSPAVHYSYPSWAEGDPDLHITPLIHLTDHEAAMSVLENERAEQWRMRRDAESRLITEHAVSSQIRDESDELLGLLRDVQADIAETGEVLSRTVRRLNNTLERQKC